MELTRAPSGITCSKVSEYLTLKTRMKENSKKEKEMEGIHPTTTPRMAIPSTQCSKMANTFKTLRVKISDTMTSVVITNSITHTAAKRTLTLSRKTRMLPVKLAKPDSMNELKYFSAFKLQFTYLY